MVVVSWIFGVIFLLAALVFLGFKAYFFFFANLIIAAVLIPPSTKFIGKKLNFNIKIWLKAVIIVLSLALQLILGTVVIYNAVSPIVQKFADGMENAYVAPSEVISNVSKSQTEALLDFEEELQGILGACHMATKTNRANKEAVKRICENSYDKLAALEVPKGLPVNVAALLEDAKNDYMYFLDFVLISTTEFKPKNMQDGLYKVSDYFISLINGTIKVQKAKKMMGITPLEAQQVNGR